MSSSVTSYALRFAVGLVVAVLIILLVNRITDDPWLRMLLLGAVLAVVYLRKRLWPFRRTR